MKERSMEAELEDAKVQLDQTKVELKQSEAKLEQSEAEKKALLQRIAELEAKSS